MNDSGFILIAREMLDHPVFANEPYCERLAWVWLIREAAWKDRTVRVGRAVIALSRGVCAVSTRFLADRWQWSEARVRRYLKRIEKQGLIDIKTDAHATQITICNYDKYQLSTQTSDAEATQGRRTSDANKKELNTLNTLEIDKSISCSKSRHAKAENRFEEFWKIYPKKASKPAGQKSYDRAVKRASEETILAGVKVYAAQRAGQDPKYTKNASTWLNNDCWTETMAGSAQPDWRDDPIYAGVE
ncbi:hypothetical protein WMC41_16065 [Shinella yambaruensis]|uniref:hypothetical protein n=1 Tax=Shinella yambaruensis TaxID=415996 RepID=UPI003D794FB1